MADQSGPRRASPPDRPAPPFAPSTPAGRAGAADPPELWGGIECTVNRVGDVWFDQLARSGHDERLDDLDRIAALGIRTLRYPILWERTAPSGPERADWRWPDERLARLRDLGIRPIVGLVHHGSGPAGTHLLDPGFAAGLASFARAVAERYPWVEDWTPVNEPLTTARFAALYGHWYPHAHDERAYIRALVIQCRAVQQAMRAVREVIPTAHLVQTEDLGKTWSTPPLAYQADYENERRWLSLDFLCGRVGRTHPLWAHLWWLGLEGDDLFPLLEEPCPPDVIGCNYYLTTERFLDHRLEHYPPERHGGNGRDAYVDVEAVRVRREGVDGISPLLREAWARYGRPLAITEAHLGCTREDQIRWLAEVWREARAVRAAGVDLRAVTVWSLLGAYDWHCLLTRCEEVYEPGVFDLRAPVPRPTALARLAARLAAGEEPDHPLLADQGWWRRPERLLYPPWPPAPPSEAAEVDPSSASAATIEPTPDSMPAANGGVVGVLRTAGVPHGSEPAGTAAADRPSRDRPRPRPLLIVGTDGPLGKAIVATCRNRGIRIVATAVDALIDRTAAASVFDECAPWAVIDARLHLGEVAKERARLVQTLVEGVGTLAAGCGERSLPLVAVSSGLVFDGVKGAPYVESDPPSPVDPVGGVNAAVEAAVAAHHPDPLVVRAGLPLLSEEPDASALALTQDAAAAWLFSSDAAGPVSVAALPDLADALLDLLIDGERGLWHLAHPEPVAPDALRRIAGVPDPAAGAAARRPRDAAGLLLASERGWIMPSLERVRLRPAS